MPSKIQDPQFHKLERELDEKIQEWKKEDKKWYDDDKKKYGGRYLDNKDVSTSMSTWTRNAEGTSVDRMHAL